MQMRTVMIGQKGKSKLPHTTKLRRLWAAGGQHTMHRQEFAA